MPDVRGARSPSPRAECRAHSAADGVRSPRELDRPARRCAHRRHRSTRAQALLPFADLEVGVGAAIEVGRVAGGLRRLIPIVGRHCRGRDFDARVLPDGADFQLVTSETVARLESRYVLKTDGGDRIYVHNDALHTAPAAVMGRLARGEPVDPLEVYFRCVPRFETSASALAWIAERIFVGVGVRRPSNVEMRFFELL
ncbi:MAG TPA: DUF3237 domain-containing protein [Caldimonas sp.]|jgi:hypothetical protein|nr:DUF3237 domain-containing protein [Caldimonas sp.]HEX4234848.1 DUF3237 domain-containing protein [Caldimonas sp.]